ncbi:hypothetical protein [Dyadobacter sediminis]|uniref:Lipoprotein SmpA/OmlA domain-containing protein n=1 Tax=Dyadobacter sediminis TaxID=1493691 RepID=A0A5R9KCF1_9BACT|nr:hypothetical protein [Dyadobacter sediminis]TLU92392.1 hypothetical protein FEM55_16860 [Dyadobacter sediminis]GGB94820.1 hypothetical protein GCM10011325_22750 [Dyadobacter sediminis]
MKTIKLLLFFLAACFLNACISNNIAWKTNENMRLVKIGMTKEEVIHLLGNKYMITSSSNDAYGNPVEVLGYKSDADEEYKLKFVSNQLKEWNREHVNKYTVKDPSILN